MLKTGKKLLYHWRKMNDQTATFFKEYGMQLALQAVGVVVLVLNLWLTSKLAPLAQNLEFLTTRVSANEEQIKSYSIDHTDIQVIKEQVINIRSDVADMKTDIKYLRSR